jgi:hypothetical protein
VTYPPSLSQWEREGGWAATRPTGRKGEVDTIQNNVFSLLFKKPFGVKEFL